LSSTAKQKRNQQLHRKSRQRRARAIQLAIIGVVAAIILILLLNHFSPGTLGGTDHVVSAANVDGSPGAPVKIVEFGDFGCPSCRAWHSSGIKERLQAEFGESVSFTFRHFPVITGRSPRAAEASQCAAEQDSFWEYHNYLYEVARQGALSDEQLKGYARQLGLDGTSFDQCLAEGRQRAYVRYDQSDAVAAGARGTPTFFINDRLVDFFSYDNMAAVVRDELGS